MAGTLGLIPRSGRSPRVENSNLLQYSRLENSMDSPWGCKRVRHDSVIYKISGIKSILYLHSYLPIHLGLLRDEYTRVRFHCKERRSLSKRWGREGGKDVTGRTLLLLKILKTFSRMQFWIFVSGLFLPLLLECRESQCDGG